MAITDERHRKDLLLVALVPVLWGLNFPATSYGLRHFPPILMAGVRFLVLSIPAVLVVPRPAVPLKWLLGTGFGMGLAQFGLLYLGMAAGMPPGLASLVLQASAPFTLVLSALFLRERLRPRQLVGVGLAAAGLATIALHRSQHARLLPVALTLGAALGWAVGNVSSRQARAPKPFQLTMWMSLVPPLPLLALSLVVEGWARDRHALATVATRAALPSVLGLLYVIVFASVLGYGIWNTLLGRHPASDVAPWSMLVPVVGVLSSWLLFGERPGLLEVLAGALVVGGVLYATLPPRRVPRTTR